MPDFGFLNVEVFGDPRTDDYKLVVPKVAVPGAVSGTPLVGNTFEVAPGLTLLSIHPGPPGSGAFDVPVEEIGGDVPTDDLRLVLEKDQVPEMLGQNTNMSLIQSATAWALVGLLPEPAPPPGP